MRTRDIEKENLVKKIAVETIAKGGFESFSMNKLAKACGISVATLYIYYKDKDDLLSQLAVEHGRMLAKSMLHNLMQKLLLRMDYVSSGKTGIGS